MTVVVLHNSFKLYKVLDYSLIVLEYHQSKRKEDSYSNEFVIKYQIVFVITKEKTLEINIKVKKISTHKKKLNQKPLRKL